ncbi:alpha/beta hydrolase [uncultured Paludibaculum sp.]|uniref:alpha/beta hydrolase n=1 Tax=uncultured Paludibaculum sp. TaxID=1765020 RepID=UPI002AAB3286|nr:alpha/beta hydrolase [uncultured Paludibaculum sp.]
MPLDPEVAALLERQKGLPPRSSLSVAATRDRMREAGALAGPPPPLALVEDLPLPGPLGARHYSPTEDAGQPVVLYFHGGRFFSGDLESHDTVCRLLAVAAGCRVIAVDYRLAPEHPFPAAAEDACRALEWVSKQGVPVAIAGDSAGANLAAVAALALRTPAVRCQVLIYPMIDAQCGSPSFAEYADGYGPGAVDMKRGWSEYLPEGTDPCNPLASPLYARDTVGMPPAFILTAEYDTLRDEGEAYARELMESGNLVQLRRYPGTIHGFFVMPGTLRLAREAMRDVAAFLRLHLGLTR